MKAKYITLIAGALVVIPAFGVSSFTGAIDSDFTNAGNWNGQPDALPTNANIGTIKRGSTVKLASGTAAALIVNGTLNKSGKSILSIGTNDLKIGVGSGETGTVNIFTGSTLEVFGNGAHVFIGEKGAGGGKGFLNMRPGSTLDARKGIYINNGRLTLKSTVTVAAKQPQIRVNVEDAGVLRFETDGAAIATIGGDNFDLNLSSGSTLEMDLGGVYSNGDSWTIFTGVSNFKGKFGSIIDPNDPTQQFTIDYGTATAGEVVVTAVPEPSAAALIGLGGLALILRRRK